MAEQRPPRVFISYRQEADRPEHQDRVLALADRLIAEGIETDLDQYERHPPEGWPTWCERRILAADFVLIVCTPSFRRSVEGEEPPGSGHGVMWEARLIRQLLYDHGSSSAKLVPVLFSDGSPDDIPVVLRGASYHTVDRKDGWENLYRQLTQQPKARRPQLGKLRKLPERERQWREQPVGNLDAVHPAECGGPSTAPLGALPDMDQPRRSWTKAWWVTSAAIFGAVATLDGFLGFQETILSELKDGFGIDLTTHAALLKIASVIIIAIIAAVCTPVAFSIAMAAGQRVGQRARGPASEEDLRKRYLDFMKEDIGERLKVSLQNAILLELKMQNTPEAVLSYRYQARRPTGEPPQVFDTFDQAYDAIEGPMLLLGEPGSGKTTTLLALAERLVEKALADPNAPIPLFESLASFPEVAKLLQPSTLSRLLGKESAPEHMPIVDIVAHLVSRRHVGGLTRAAVRKWIQEGQVIIILDGLDQVEEKSRNELIVSLKATLLGPDYWDIRTLISSRIIEYYKTTQEVELISGSGAVTILPLEDDAIDSYLHAAGAGHIAEVVAGDATLRDLSRNPLSLFLLVVAGRKARELSGENTRLLHTRAKLFDEYLKQMIRRERAYPNHWDINDPSEVTEKELRSRVYGPLGKFAILLSERARVRFPTKSPAAFFRESNIGGWTRFWTLGRVTDAVTACLLVSALVIAGAYREGSLDYTAIFPALIATYLVLAFGAQNEGTVKGWQETFLIITFATALMFVLFVFSRCVSDTLSGSMSTVSIASLLVLIVAVVGGLVDCITSWKKGEYVRAARTCTGITRGTLWGAVALGVVLLVFGLEITATSSVMSAIMAFFLGVQWGSEDRDGWWQGGLGIITACGVIAGTDFVVSQLAWPTTVSAVAVLSALFFGLADRPQMAFVMWAAAIVGLVSFGHKEAVIFAMGGVLLTLLLASTGVFAERLGDHLMADRLVWVLAQLTGRLPLFPMRRVRFAHRALIMRQNQNSEVEFIHDLLRDHLATRDAIAELNDDASPRRKRAILRSLSLRGISAFDALVDFTRDTREPDPVIRRAAVAGVSRMNMEAVPYELKRVIRMDRDVSVQVVAAEGVAVLANPDVVVPSARDSRHPEVRMALIEALATRKDVSNYASTIAQLLGDENDTVVKRAILLLDQYCPSDLTGLRSTAQSNEDRVLGMVQSIVAEGTTAEKFSALRFLGRARLAAGGQLCIEALANKKKNVRIAASFALAQFAYAGVHSAVLTALLRAASDTNKIVRFYVVGALARHIESFGRGEHTLSAELRQAEDCLCRMTRDRNADVRARAIENISIVLPRDASFFVDRALRDRSPAVRRAALAYACNKPGIVSKGLLFANLSHADPAVQREAARALFICQEPGDRERLLQTAANPWSRRRAGAILFIGYCAGDDPAASSRIEGILNAEETLRATVRRFALGFLGLLGLNWPSPIGACFEALLLAQDQASRSKVKEYAAHGRILFRMLAQQVLDRDKSSKASTAG